MRQDADESLWPHWLPISQLAPFSQKHQQLLPEQHLRNRTATPGSVETFLPAKRRTQTFLQITPHTGVESCNGAGGRPFLQLRPRSILSASWHEWLIPNLQPHPSCDSAPVSRRLHMKCPSPCQLIIPVISSKSKAIGWDSKQGMQTKMSK